MTVLSLPDKRKGITFLAGMVKIRKTRLGKTMNGFFDRDQRREPLAEYCLGKGLGIYTQIFVTRVAESPLSLS